MDNSSLDFLQTKISILNVSITSEYYVTLNDNNSKKIYKSHALRDKVIGFWKKKVSSQRRGFQILFLSEFFQIIRQKASFYWLVS